MSLKDAVQTQSNISERKKTNKPTNKPELPDHQRSEKILPSPDHKTPPFFHTRHSLAVAVQTPTLALDSQELRMWVVLVLITWVLTPLGRTSLVLSSWPGNKCCANKQEKQSISQPLFLSRIFCLSYHISHPRPKHITCIKIAAWRWPWYSSSYFITLSPGHKVPWSFFKHTLSCSILAYTFPSIHTSCCVLDLTVLSSPS